MQIGPLGDEARPGHALRDVVILRVRERLHVLRSGLDRRGLDVRRRVRVVRLDEPHMVEEELVRSRRTELALFEKQAHLRRSAVVVVGHHLHDHRHLVWRVALENDVIHDQLLPADACALLDRTLDDIASHARPPGFLDGSEKARVRIRFGAAEFGRDHDFFDDFADHLTLFQAGDFTFCLEPLASHRVLKMRSW